MVHGRSKRKLEDFDPNKSDSDDGDYDNAAPTSSQKARGKARSSHKHKSQNRKPAKRRRERYGDSEDDIEDDDDDDISEDEESIDEDSEEEEAPVNPKTGRRQRVSASRKVQYEESEDEIEETDASRSPSPRRKPGQPPRSLIVTLHISPEKMSRVTRSTGRGHTPVVTSATGARRSSRVSRQSEEPLISLTDSGKHTQVVRQGSRQPSEDPLSRAQQGGKSVKKLPSAIMEASQEFSGQDFVSQLEEHAVGAEDTDFKTDLQPAQELEYEEMQLETDVVPQSDAEGEEDTDPVKGDAEEDDDDDDGPIRRKPSRSLRSQANLDTPPTRRSMRPKKSAMDQSSDFEPEAEIEEEPLSSDDGQRRRGKHVEETSDSASNTRRSGRLSRRNGTSRRQSAESGGSEIDLDEVAEEAADLAEDRRQNKRPRRGRRASPMALEPNLRTRSKAVDYRIYRPELQAAFENDDDNNMPPSGSQRNNRRAAAPARTLFSTFGPFGGAGGPLPVFGGPEGIGAAGGADSDSSDDDMQPTASKRRGTIGGGVGMTPNLGLMPQSHNADPAQASGGPANFGKVKDRKLLADADPIGVDTNVNFDGVGGLDNHINQLKEMVALPLLYPEVFMSMHITPPRGVLFHGPPGTGKTLLARALASSVSTQGKKVTFYMRKGADALSKWVGEAERQLRLLFEEARKNAPSIIFFDEIDGLAPVRSSKQEQIHASIVATLLALMDGMDGRGQVIVIGATNRPDSVDPALRRPGRFDREFYFPLPNKDARRSIINIHTNGWEPPLKDQFKDQLAELTKGYGGADLRALCTEAALNAVQGTFPQIYSSNKKLLIDPSKIKVLAKDFMISVNKIVPSSERSATSGAAPLKKSVEPLLRQALAEIAEQLNRIIPQKKKTTALEEAMYDDREDELGFEKETMQREFESARIFRPRLLIRGVEGMGQQYIGAALLNKFEGLYVSSFDLPTLLKDSTRSAEAAVVQLFEEVKRHKPSVIYIPNVETWYNTLQEPVIRTFTGLLRSLAPTEPVLVLGILEASSPDEQPDPRMMRDLFGYSTKSSYILKRPDHPARREYFAEILQYVKRAPADFPALENRKKRILEELPEAPVIEEAPQGPSKAEVKAQRRKDHHNLNMLKLFIQRVMDQIKLKYKKFRTPPIDDSLIAYLYDEQDPNLLSTDLGDDRAREHMHRPYKLEADSKGVTGLREVATGKFYYNLEIVTIEKRLSNGYYKRPRDFEADIRRLAKDAETSGDQDRILKGNEMLANVQVDMTDLETTHAVLTAECENIYIREQARAQELRKQGEEQARKQGNTAAVVTGGNVPPDVSFTTTEQTTGPVHLGIEVPAPRPLPPITPLRPESHQSNGYSHSNGEHPQRVDSDVRSIDVTMGNSQDTSGMPNPQDQAEPQHQASNPNPGQDDQTQKSQRSSIMQLAHGSQAQDYHNSASTTTSGQKTSDRSGRSSDQTRLSNGTHQGEGPDYTTLGHHGGSQLPDTQEQPLDMPSPRQTSPAQASNSQGFSQASSQMAPPARRSSINALLNTPAPAEPKPTLITPDAEFMHGFENQLVHASSGLSVEQLEQTMAALMRAVWDTRSEWNRNVAASAVMAAFNETVADIEEIQKVLKPSQDD